MDDLFLALQSALAGRYSLERELGRGGMGVVYLASDVRLDRRVAIKLLPPHFAGTPLGKEHFLREARTAARLNHPHIVPIHSVEEAGGFVFFVMTFIDGITLARRVAEEGPVPAAEATRILREIAWALDHAHAHGVVHRDIKPENILLEASGRALVTDFGIARVPGNTPPSGEVIMGTANAISPEQAGGEPVDGRSDLYALGVVGYFMMTGRYPFTGGAAAIVAQHLTQPAPELRREAPGIPPGLASAIQRCLAKDPAGRFASGAVLAETLGRELERAPRIAPALQRYLQATERSSALRVFPALLATAALADTFLNLVLNPLFGEATPHGRLVLTINAIVVYGASVCLPAWLARRRLRQVQRAGHDHDAFIHALERDTRERREEPPARTAGALAWLGSVAVFAGLVAAAIPAGIGSPAEGFLILGAGAVATLGSGAGWRSWAGSGLRTRFWKSRVGSLLFRLSGAGVSRDATAFDQNVTELALGSATLAIFDALPSSTRKTFAELPGVVGALERKAREIRIRDDGTGNGAELAGAISALEQIRLDLLRLRADAAAATNLTEDLRNARKLGEKVDSYLSDRNTS